jgi:hypothetical protein
MFSSIRKRILRIYSYRKVKIIIALVNVSAYQSLYYFVQEQYWSGLTRNLKLQNNVIIDSHQLSFIKIIFEKSFKVWIEFG